MLRHQLTGASDEIWVLRQKVSCYSLLFDKCSPNKDLRFPRSQPAENEEKKKKEKEKEETRSKKKKKKEKRKRKRMK